MLMPDHGLGLWGSYADFEPIESDNMTIDLDSFMGLLDEEPPPHVQFNSAELSSSEVLMMDLIPGADAQGPDIKKSETRTGNYISTADTRVGIFGAPESGTSKQESMHMPVKNEPSTESLISHFSGGTFEDNISTFSDSRLLPVQYNDYYQSFPLDKEMSAGMKDETGNLTEENTYVTGDTGCNRSSDRTSFEFLGNDGISDVMNLDCKSEYVSPFLSLGRSCFSGSDEENELLSWSSLYMSTFSSKKQVVKDERHDLAIPLSNIGETDEVSIRNNFSFGERHHLNVDEEAKEMYMARTSERVENNTIQDESYGKLIQPNATNMLYSIPTSVHQIRVDKEDMKLVMATACHRGHHSENSCTEDEISSTLTRPFINANVPSNLSPESTESNSVDCRSQVDEESDICIIEEMSHPAPPNLSVIPGKSLSPPKPSTFYDSCHYSGHGGTRIKTNSERLIFRVALQDLSQPKLELNPPEGDMAVPLLRHQRIALAWMVKKETAVNCSGGILADDQGLGKTVSTISLILKERPPSVKSGQNNMKLGELNTLNLDDDADDDNDDSKVSKSKVMKMEADAVAASSSATRSGNSCPLAPLGRPAGGNLVVCPTSVLRQWADELHNKVTAQANLSVLVYHGGSRTKDPFELAKHDVVLTTYSIVSMEVPKQPLVEKDDVEYGKRADDISGAECLSNRKRKNSSSSKNRKSKDGKEIGNGLLDSTAGPLAKVGWFRVILDEAQSIKNHKTQTARACWGLRAKRRWCLSGTPIQNSIDDLYSYFKFLRYDPYDTYATFCSNIKAPIHRSPSKGYKKLQAILKTIMLRRTKGTLLDGEPIITLPPKSVILQKVEFSKEERDFYSKLEADSRAQFKEYAAAGTVKENYVNILLMLLRLRQACDHPLLVKGYDSSSVWKASVEMARQLPPEKQRDLLNRLEASLAICTICNDPPEEAVVSICGHVFCNQCISEHVTGDECECPATDCKARLSRSSTFSRAALGISLCDHPIMGGTSGNSEFVETDEPCSVASPYSSSKIKAALKVLQSLSQTQQSTSKTSQEQNSSGESSCSEDLSYPRDSPEKRNYCEDKRLNDSKKPAGEKAIVFSQWTKMLDLIEDCLKSSCIQYRRLDGTMSVAARDKAVKEFNTLPEVTVMIMSLKAASLGLNMVSACHVFLMDLWWNPTTEDQAIDRAHRIGQTRPVTVLRLTVKDTVEDRILALQQRKRVMVASAFGEDETGSRQTRLTVDDLNYLFMV